MGNTTTIKNAAPGKVALTLELDPEVYEAFLRKARQGGMDVEIFLSNTLTIVLGCRVFNEQHACSPALHDTPAQSPAKPLNFKP